MTTSTSHSAPEVQVIRPHRANLMAHLLREPLLHFVILGGLLFAVDHYLVSKRDDLHTIVVGPEVDRVAVEEFKKVQGREPTSSELMTVHRVWLDSEILYREGLAKQLDKGDTAIRERVIFKVLNMLDANLKPQEVNDEILRAWFEKNREKYDEPARYNFQEAVFAEEKSEADIRELVANLNSAKASNTPADVRVFKDRLRTDLEQSYDAEFPSALESAPVGVWQAVKSRGSWRAVLLDSFTARNAAQFEALRTVILQDWKRATAAQMPTPAERRTAAVRTLEEKYKIEFTSPADKGDIK